MMVGKSICGADLILLPNVRRWFIYGKFLGRRVIATSRDGGNTAARDRHLVSCLGLRPPYSEKITSSRAYIHIRPHVNSEEPVYDNIVVSDGMESEVMLTFPTLH